MALERTLLEIARRQSTNDRSHITHRQTSVLLSTSPEQL